MSRNRAADLTARRGKEDIDMLITQIVKGKDFSRYDHDSVFTFDRVDRNGTRYYLAIC